jgi:hypothetical protein
MDLADTQYRYRVTNQEAFWIMVQLMHGQQHMMRGMYLVGLPLTMKYIFIFEKLLLRFEPQVAAHLVDVPTTSYTSKWFMTIFSGLSFECMVRVWDAFVNEGTKVLFRVSIAIMRIFRGTAQLQCFGNVCFPTTLLLLTTV